MRFKIDPQNDLQIVKNSVFQIVTPEDLVSKKLGPMTNNENCETCGNEFLRCNGHAGHLNIPYGYMAPFLLTKSLALLQNTCINCLRFNKDPKDTCQYCFKKFTTFQVTMIENCVVMSIQCTKIQAYKIKSILFDAKVKPNLSNELVQLDYGIIKAIFHNYVVNGDIKKFSFHPKILDCMVLYNVPVPAAQFRVSQPDIGQYNVLNTLFQKIIRSKQYTEKLDVIDDLYVNISSQQLQYWRNMHISIYLLMTHDSNVALQEMIGFQKFSQPTSLLAASLKKEGHFRASINGVRVDKSSRTVITGDPYIACTEVVCPIMIAEKISVPVRVNDVNIDYCRRLIDNFPNYPCALRYITRENDIYHQNVPVNTLNKDWYTQQIQIGDIVGRQIITGDICQVNRYPSIREESFGSHVVIVRDIKTIQFNMSVIGKMTADFDGDEMQLFFMASPADQAEIALLSSAMRQLITYENGLNLIGGAQDLPFGIYWLQNYAEFETSAFGVYSRLPGAKKTATGLELVEQYLPSGLQAYDDGKIVIEGGKLTKISDSICDKNSAFITFMQFHFGQDVALQFIDSVIWMANRANELCGSSLYSSIFDVNQSQQKPLTQQRMDECDEVLEQFYSGTFETPMGVDPKAFLEQYIQALQSKNQLAQVNILIQCLKVETEKGEIEPYYNKFVASKIDALKAGCIAVGQARDEKGQRVTHPVRVFPRYRKFDFRSVTQGYIRGNYVDGLTQTEMFYDSIIGRYQAYKKGNQVRDDGYAARRLSKGADNQRMGQNGIILGESNVVTSLQYGSAGYDPRCYTTVDFPFVKMSDAELSEKFGAKHPMLDEILSIVHDLQLAEGQIKSANPKWGGTKKLVVPFKFLEKTVSQTELARLWNCRLVPAMSDEFMDIIHQQVIQYFIYALFFLEIDPKSKHDIVSPYLRALVNPGESVGPKASMASTQPLTQSTLHAIHKKLGGSVAFIKMVETAGAKRFMELVLANVGPITFQTQLIGSQCHNKKINELFVSKYQTIPFKDLDPLVNIYYNQAVIQLDIKISYKKLGYNNVTLRWMIQHLVEDFDIQKTNIIDADDHVVIECKFNAQRELNEIQTIKIKLKGDYEFGSGFLHNVFYEEAPGSGPDPDQHVYYIKGNLDPEKYQDLLTIRGIDQGKTFCNDVREYQSLFGVQRAHNVLYDQLAHNLGSDSSTKEVQKVHVKLLSDTLMQQGEYFPFTRQSYKKQKNRDFLQLIVFEEAQIFVLNEMLNPTPQVMNTMLNAQTFGTRADAGPTQFQISIALPVKGFK